MANPRDRLTVTPHAAAHPEIGPWLWAMEETRRGLLDTVVSLGQDALDWRGPSGTDNSIGSLLFHVALVEMSWLYEDVRLEEPPEDIGDLFPVNHRDADGVLSHVPGRSLDDHLHRLDVTRRRFLELIEGMTPTDWHTVREPHGADYACSPAWVVFHLVEHEAGHLFQVREIKRRWWAAQQ